jgi:hypothetical protein
MRTSRRVAQFVLWGAFLFGVPFGVFADTFPVKGIKLWTGNIPGMFNEYLGRPHNSTNFYRFRDVLEKIERSGANYVTIQLSAGVMSLPTDNGYSVTSFNPELAGVRALAADIKSRGLKVGVSFFVNVENVITGAGGSDRPAPTDPIAWIAAHRARMIEWAKFATEIGASSLILFQDEVQNLLALPELESHWLDLITAVRAHYSGAITSVLWTPGHGESITRIPASIISRLDYLGVGFFPNLSRADLPGVDDLVRAYSRDVDGRDVLGFLRDLSTRYNKKIWITDKAFHSFLGAGADEFRVFNSTIPLTPSETVQANLYDSFLQVMAAQSREWLHGVSFQNFSNIVPGAFQIARFVAGPFSESPQNKQAESILRDWFSGTRTTPRANFLANVSVRAAMTQGQTLIVGFSMAGGAKPVLLRVSGPALNDFGLTGLPNPRLRLFDGAGIQLTENDDWSSSLTRFFNQVGAFPWNTKSRDAALLPTLAGTHSVHAIGEGNGTVLVEAYDAGPNIGPTFSNLSARHTVGSGGDLLIAGFVIQGVGRQRLLIRAIGPRLADFGVSNVLAEPRLAIFDGANEIAAATGWTADQASVFAQAGAFALTPGSADSALVITLEAGRPYTAQVSGLRNTTGEALVEVYTLP